MAFQDREIACRDCGAGFIFTGGEQEFYASKGLQHDPVRCPACRQNRKALRPEDRDDTPSYGVFVSWGGRTPRELHMATCAECRQVTEVPFRPRGDRPVFCSNCYNAVREREQAAEEAMASAVASAPPGAPLPELEGTGAPTTSPAEAALAAVLGGTEPEEQPTEAEPGGEPELPSLVAALGGDPEPEEQPTAEAEPDAEPEPPAP